MIVAFLQNAYTWSEEQARKNEEVRYHPDKMERYQALLKEAIAEDSDNHTYRRLRKALGPDACRQVWWDNASPRWGWRHDHKFPADHDMRRLDQINAELTAFADGVKAVSEH